MGWEVIMKIAATWKNVDSITFCEKKNTKVHICYDFKYAQVKKNARLCISENWREHEKIF